MFAKIVFKIPINNFYYYSIPDKLEAQVSIGCRVEVNFNNRNTYGYVIDIKKKIDRNLDLKKIKPVLFCIDSVPLFTEQILKLAFWISSYYFASIGEVIKLMTPSGVKAKEYVFDKLWRKDKNVILTDKQQEIFDSLKKLDTPDYALIYGITGSGKTEIYLALMEHYIKKKSRLSTLCLRYPLPNN